MTEDEAKDNEKLSSSLGSKREIRVVDGSVVGASGKTKEQVDEAETTTTAEQP